MQTLETRQLIAFTELARLGSFTEVANQLGLTQSAVSHSIKALEKQLEVVLFERFGKNVSLTLEGKLYCHTQIKSLLRCKLLRTESKF